MKRTRALFAGILFPVFMVGQNVGIGVSNPQSKLHIYNGTLFIEGITGATPASGAGARLMWIPQRRALRAGEVTGTHWNDANIGLLSVAFGSNNLASGDRSFAMGMQDSAIGANSFAIGGFTKATGFTSTATGYETKAEGDYSLSAGRNTTAVANFSVAMGSNSTSLGGASFALGIGNSAAGAASIAIGHSNTTTDDYCLATGFLTEAHGQASTAMGSSTKAFGNGSVAMNGYTQSHGVQSLATGYNTRAYGHYTAAFGYGTITNGLYSAGGGLNSKTDGNISFAFGNGLISKHWGGFVVGHFNDSLVDGSITGPDDDNRLFQVGNGINNSNRSNAMTVFRNGRVGIGTVLPGATLHVAGDGYFSGDIRVDNNRGIVKSRNSTQQKILHATVTVNFPNMPSNATTTYTVNWPESFSSSPVAYVGNIVTATNGWAEVDMTIASVTTTGAVLWVHNTFNGTHSKSFSVNIIAYGAD